MEEFVMEVEWESRRPVTPITRVLSFPNPVLLHNSLHMFTDSIMRANIYLAVNKKKKPALLNFIVQELTIRCGPLLYHPAVFLV
jgi:hypothetical protein